MRCAASLASPDAARSAADLISALGVPAAAVRHDAALGTLPGEPGHAAGPYRFGDLALVGEVTIHNRQQMIGELAGRQAGADGPELPDGELLLRLYAHLGSAGIAAVEGMIAAAVLDGPELVLIRDHVGARTMFFGRAEGQWLASTSLRTLRRWPALRTGLNLAAVRSFLTFAYLPGEETLLTGVREILPGRITRLRPDGSVHIEQFWEPSEEHAGPDRSGPDRSGPDRSGPDREELVARLRELLVEATARRLPIGGPAAVLLSGGVDSSLVTALAVGLHNGPVHTYSIAFGDDLPNELAYSALVATHCRTTHRVLTVPGERIASRLADTVALLDAPVGDPLTVPNALLNEAVAGDGGHQLLNGEGGDPVFGGPKNLPMLVHEMQRAAAGAQGAVGAGDANERRVRAYLRSYRKCGDDLAELLTPQTLTALSDQPEPGRHVAPYLTGEPPAAPMSSLLNRLLYANLRTKGAHHILTKVERLTAAAGLQGRSPLFDRAVIDHAFALPPRLKLVGTVEKWALKEAVRDLLPSTIIDRPKSGMRVPVQRWLSGPLRRLCDEVLLDHGAVGRDLFRADTLRGWRDGRGSVLPRQGGKLWLVLTLELWLRAYDVHH